MDRNFSKMKIKNYIQFIKESSGYQYGCVMVEIPVSNWNEITSSIDEEDIYEEEGDSTYGIQQNPHLTLLYGLHDTVTPDMIKSVFDNFTDNINIVVDGIDIFENEKFDVVKFNVKPDGALQYLHNELSKFPNSDQYPDYKPHITICYVKKGTGKKYIKPDYKYEVKNVDKITYSIPSGEKIKFNYKKSKLESYSFFIENLNQNKYSIFDFYDYLRNNKWSNTDISTLERWTDHFVGDGWWNKVKSHVDRMFDIFLEVDLKHIENAMLDIFDTVPEEKEKNIYCAVLYGNYEKINDSNEYKYNGTMPVFDADGENRKCYILHNIVFEIIKPTINSGGLYNEVSFRTTPEAEYVTDKRWQCQNFDFSQFTELKDYEMKTLNLYSPENVLNAYKPGVVIDIGGWSSIDAHRTGKMSLLNLEKELDERIDLITANLDYEEVLWPFSRKERYFDTSRPIYDYTLKILLKM